LGRLLGRQRRIERLGDRLHDLEGGISLVGRHIGEEGHGHACPFGEFVLCHAAFVQDSQDVRKEDLVVQDSGLGGYSSHPFLIAGVQVTGPVVPIISILFLHLGWLIQKLGSHTRHLEVKVVPQWAALI
jgi:hypothetical protein